MEYKKGDWVLHSQGIFHSFAGKDELHVGQALGTTMVAFDGRYGESKRKPKQLLGVYKTEEEAKNARDIISGYWDAENKKMSDIWDSLRRMPYQRLEVVIPMLHGDKDE